MPPRKLTLIQGGRQLVVEVLDDNRVSVDGEVVTLRRESGGTVRFEGGAGVAWTAWDGDRRWVFLDGRVYDFKVAGSRPARPAGPASSRRDPGEAASAQDVTSSPGALAAPMPATVRRVAVSPGDAVKRGDTVVILEAMKMELPVRAPGDGRVRAVHCREGDLVDAGETLVEIAD